MTKSTAFNCEVIRLIELMSILILIKIFSYCKLITSKKTTKAVVPVRVLYRLLLLPMCNKYFVAQVYHQISLRII